MFSGFAEASDQRFGRRYAMSASVSAFFYALLVTGILFMPRRETTTREEEEKRLDVTFRPAAAPSPPPAPVLPRTLKVKKVKPTRVAQVLVEPKMIPQKKLQEADPKDKVTEVADSGDENQGTGGGAAGGVTGGTGSAVAAPPPPPAHRDPINLPESGTPPVPDPANPIPDYPSDARSRGLEGLVILKIVVSETGHVTKVEVMRGDEPFVSAAIATVRRWRYSPAVVDGRPASVFRIVKVPFKLKG